jgi:PIN domain nuclease of toxin-antitoxin system
MNILTDERNGMLLSAASARGIARKFRHGKLHLYDSPDRYVPDRLLAAESKDSPSISAMHCGSYGWTISIGTRSIGCW